MCSLLSLETKHNPPHCPLSLTSHSFLNPPPSNRSCHGHQTQRTVFILIFPDFSSTFQAIDYSLLFEASPPPPFPWLLFFSSYFSCWCPFVSHADCSAYLNITCRSSKLQSNALFFTLFFVHPFLHLQLHLSPTYISRWLVNLYHTCFWDPVQIYISHYSVIL